MSEATLINESQKATWFKRIAAWEGSGKTQPQYCSEQGFSLNTFTYWRGCYLTEQRKPSSLSKKTSIGSTEKNEPIQFASLQLKTPKVANTETVQVRFASGSTLSLPLSMPVADALLLLQGLGV